MSSTNEHAAAHATINTEAAAHPSAAPTEDVACTVLREKRAGPAEKNIPRSFENWAMAGISAAEELAGTFWKLLWRPALAPQLAAAERSHPLSFLVVALLLSGLVAQTAILYLGRQFDGNMFDLFGQALVHWGIRELVLLTLPPIALIWCLARATCWSLAPSSQRTHSNFLFRGLCHSLGMQFLLLGIMLGLFLCTKGIASEPGQDHRWTRDSVLVPAFLIALIPGILQVERLLDARASYRWAQRSWLRIPVSVSLTLVCTIGVLAIGAETFQFRKTDRLADRARMEAWEGRARILVEVLQNEIAEDSRPRTANATEPIYLRQHVALTNVTNHPHAVPFPHQLQLVNTAGGKPGSGGAVAVQPANQDQPAPAGWVIQPHETIIVSWQLRLPASLTQQKGLSGTFSCVEIDLDRWTNDIERPFGKPSPCFVALKLDTLIPSMAAREQQEPRPGRF